MLGVRSIQVVLRTHRIHASIYTTIKTMKFSHLAPVCGGPVEVAVISSDRPFRWVRHKKMEAAIVQGGFADV